MKITFIGGGNMAGALIGGLLARGHRASDLLVVDPSDTARAALERHAGIVLRARAERDAVAGATVVLAVKPQLMQAVARALAPMLDGELLISVAAGIRGADLARWLGGHERIVRAMPNTPSMIGLGVCGLAACAGTNDEDRDTATRILAAVGETLWFDDEASLDAVTATSGSGPAYVFRFIEAMTEGATALGLSAQAARVLVMHTVRGAAELALRSDEPPGVLRERVTSRGGTTAAALEVMAERELGPIVAEAMRAANDRSVSLGAEFGQDTRA